MKNHWEKHLTLMLSWSFPPALIALIGVAALCYGYSTNWLWLLVFVCLVLNMVICVLLSGMCSVLHGDLLQKQRNLDLYNESFISSRKMNEHLTRTLENLSGMREIQMSSHLENFSDLLRNILNVTHGATEARSLTIHMESHRGFGIFPKAHMCWEPQDSPCYGEIFIFLEEELSEGGHVFSIDPTKTDFAEPQAEFHTRIFSDGKDVGQIHFRPTASEPISDAHELLSDFIQNFSLPGLDVVSECWSSCRLINRELEITAAVAVPIISQRLTVGVLSAEFDVPPDHQQFWEDLRGRHLDTLRDFGRNIGQPLKKEELYEMATVDGLTGLFNKVHYESQLNDYFHRMVRYERDLSFIFVDVDHFKKVNDTHGHLVGDQVLKGVASILRENIRKSDMAFRIGGEEMAVLLIETPLTEAVGVAEKLRLLLEKTRFPLKNNDSLCVTASFGVSSRSQNMKVPADLVQAADDALYKAKNTGRNRVIAASN